MKGNSMKNAIGFCLILLFITYNSIGAISLKKVASLNTSKGFPNSIHSVSESKRQFFDNGSKVLIGQDYSLSISYKFYLANCYYPLILYILFNVSSMKE